ncbi:tetratricopeptide repeat protein [Oculatella sp. FACHB-28]|uniref:tetratricopeptide repeat protein n=1 Tax=Cyanophyceae TaxID=3028117 RepID=UPI00168559AB|nr:MULTISPECIES: tetratricopeptide repeat protein [Cyanophyceae]MBD1871350.1 tetratricopeptide repeat protein [Cyanobacteria bacterium FACHB-471]MBD1997503.1 tetratricopeptide repeat protein [Leptolyngbya sp. FACHB-541]MBD2059204.1 tetratricopeptide repeat protein [Oculatella sp. FACHB-28]MBD2067212.1 tetratricopeptide repeat protein [Leptolyngbya sp. FACHB-671]
MNSVQDIYSPSDWQAQGCALCGAEQYQAAIAAFDRALSLEPKNCQTWNYRANALSALQRQAEALSCYDRAIALNPTYHQAWFNRGLLLAEMGAQGSALEAYDRAIALHPDPLYLHAWDDVWLKQKLIPFVYA